MVRVPLTGPPAPTHKLALVGHLPSLASPVTLLLYKKKTTATEVWRTLNVRLSKYRSKVLVRRNQCLLAQTCRTLTRIPINFSIRFSSSYTQDQQ